MGYFDKFNSGKGIPFMDGAEKIDIPVGEKLHVNDYGFIDNKEGGEFIVLSFREYPKKFTFGNPIITTDVRMMESDFGSKEKVLQELASVALLFKKQISKKNREYTAVEFIEEDIPF